VTEFGTLPGFEAPRNSMEFALEASHSYGVFQEDVPVSLPYISTAPLE